MEGQSEPQRTKPIAVFMAFGTQGDVYPIAAIAAAAFASDRKQYDVVFISHKAHENLSNHLVKEGIAYFPISSPPALSSLETCDNTDSGSPIDFGLKKAIITREHRQECLRAVERLFGDLPTLEDDFIVINFFALEGWSLAELFHVRCVVAAPYVVPYSAPSSFEHQFRKELPQLYKYFQEAPVNKIGWRDVIHWMWPLFNENLASWRSAYLNMSPYPFMDPITSLPTWHDRPPSPLLLYGFSKEIVEIPDYWPSSARVCGFWFLPTEWQFSCEKCREISATFTSVHPRKDDMCLDHAKLQFFLKESFSVPLIFIGLSSIGSMGFMKNPKAFLEVLQTALQITSYRFILFTAGYEPLDAAIAEMAPETSSLPKQDQLTKNGISLCDGRLFCFSGMIPYKWLFPICAAAVHHGGSGSTAAALHAGIPQIICPFVLDQFYWAEKMFWLGVAPEPLRRNHLVPDKITKIGISLAANMFSQALQRALSPDTKARALEISKTISSEDGVLEAVRILKEEIARSKSI